MPRMKLADVCALLHLNGHQNLWFLEEYETGVERYLSVLGDGGLELAWWDPDSRSWFLNDEPANPGVYVSDQAHRADLLTQDAVDLYSLAHAC